ncbi:MAG TPA: ABC transporter permease [Spirochaetia bacterium]|nr:ABC transporter permease [Spirochaetia bacterium]
MAGKQVGGLRSKITHRVVLLFALIGLIVVIGIFEPVFFKPSVLFDVTALMGEIGLMALAQTYIITTGGIDLSVGYNLQLCAIVFGMTLFQTHLIFLAVVLALVVGLLGGLLNGLIISRTRIPPLVTTLATMYLFRGISMIVAGTHTYSGFPENFKKVSNVTLFGFFPIQFIYLLVIFVVLNVLFNRGSLGRVLKGIGFNENAVIFSGTNSKRYLLWIYALSGLISGLAAIIYLGRLSSATTSMGDGLNLQVVTAVVLGGTSVFGGVGSVSGTFIATMIIGVLRKGFTLLNLSGNFFNFTLGVILIASLIVLAVVDKRKARRGVPPLAAKSSAET